MKHLRSICASAYAATISIVVTVVLAMATDFSTKFKTWLTAFTGHHWVTKSWVSIIVFAIFFCIFYSFNKTPDQNQTHKSLSLLEFAVIAGFVILVGYYFYEYLK